jgi:hypothetical protein
MKQRCRSTGHIQPGHRRSAKEQPEGEANPKALAQLDGYKRPLVGSLSANLQRFGFERVAKIETLQEMIEEIGETGDNPATALAQNKKDKTYYRHAIMIVWQESEPENRRGTLLSGI